MITQESAQIALRNAGVRITPQRLMVVDVLVDNRTHPTVEEVYERVRVTYPAISLATVYHTLTMLAERGLILALHGSQDGLRCDPETTPHAHAYCTVCGKVYDLPYPVLTTWDEEALAGFQMEHLELSIYGRCAACQQSE